MIVMPCCFNAGDTIEFPFDTYSSAGASITITGLAVTDIEVYKNGSMTQRASDNGYTLLDTDGIDLDGATGFHGFSINTSDNSDAGFWADGNRYMINVNAITVDGQTVRFTYFLALGYTLRPVTAGRKLVVDAAGLADANMVKVGPTGAGTAQTAADLAALINSIVTATGAGSLTTKTADSATLTTGSNTSGSYTDTASDNNVYWITAPVTPAVGGFGLRQQIVFNLPLGRTPVNIVIRGYWNGTGTVEVYALNSRTAVYDQLTNTGTNLASRTTELLYTIPLPRDYADDSGGSFNIVTLEFRATSTTTANRLRLDQVLVSHLDEQTATTLVAPTVSEIWNAPSRTLTTPGSEPTSAPTAEETAAAVLLAAQSTPIYADTRLIEGTDATNVLDARIAAYGAYTGTPPSAAAISTQVAADLLAAHGSGSWQTATGFAEPGDQMDLVNAPNATALDAIAVEVEAHLLDEGDSQMLINAIVGAIGNTNIDQAVLVAAIRADLERAGGNINTLIGRLTATRAANLDFLDAAVSSRLATAGYTAPPSAAAVATQVRTELTVELGRIDANVSSRMATFVYTAPDNASAAAAAASAAAIDLRLPSDPADASVIAGEFVALEAHGDAEWSGGGATAAEIDALLSTNHGAGTWSHSELGTGAREVTITVDDGTDPIESAHVRLTKGAETYDGLTDITGVVTFSVDDGTWRVVITRVGYTFAPVDLVVAANVATTYNMTQITFTPSSLARVTGYMTVEDESGIPEEGVSIVIRAQRPGKDEHGIAYDTAPRTAISDALGFIEFLNLVPGASYLLQRGASPEKLIKIPTDATDPYELPSFVGEDL